MDRDLEDLRLSRHEWTVLRDFEMILLVSAGAAFEQYANYLQPLLSVSSPSTKDNGKGSDSSPFWRHTFTGTFHV